jgi:hypothetical protein
MRHDAEVTVVLDGMYAGHILIPVKAGRRLPAVMGEGAIRLGHSVCVLPLLHGRAPVV